MVGAVLPDFTKIDWFLNSYLIENALGIPFNWGALHTFAGVLVLAGIGAVLFGRDQDHWRAGGMLLAGALGHLLVDSLNRWADGAAGSYLSHCRGGACRRPDGTSRLTGGCWSSS
mgnify:CR=1 FL=1